MKYQKLDKVLKDIHRLKYQGATAVAQATLAAYRDFGSGLTLRKPENWLAEMKAAAHYLTVNNRPTEPLAFNGLQFVWQRIREQPNLFMLRRSIDEFEQTVSRTQQDLSVLGRLIIKPNSHVLTHCHSTSVENLFVSTFAKKKFRVFSTETRPLYQGRITAKRLSQRRIPITQVVDSAAPFLLSRMSGRELSVDTVVIGADVVRPDGSVINKIGSYGIALAARTEKIPVYVVTTLLKYAPIPEVTIERRPLKEIWPQAPAGVELVNFAFDIVPAKFITGIVCEFGVIEPAAVRGYVQRYYNWVLKR